MDDPAAEAETEIVETAPAKRDEETGIAMDGDYPHNHRLRAEALAKAGEEKDPDGLISPELIADAKDRLEADATAAELIEEERRKAQPPVHARMKVEDLERIARDEGVDLTGAAKNEDRVAAIEAKRAESPNPQPPGGTGATTETGSEEA